MKRTRKSKDRVPLSSETDIPLKDRKVFQSLGIDLDAQFDKVVEKGAVMRRKAFKIAKKINPPAIIPQEAADTSTTDHPPDHP